MEHVVQSQGTDWVEAPPAEGHHAGQIQYLLNDRTHGTQRLRIMRQKYETGGWTESRVHPHLEQSYYILSGQMEVTVAGRTWKCGPGDLVYIPPGTPHQHRSVGEATLVFLTINAVLR